MFQDRFAFPTSQCSLFLSLPPHYPESHWAGGRDGALPAASSCPSVAQLSFWEEKEFITLNLQAWVTPRGMKSLAERFSRQFILQSSQSLSLKHSHLTGRKSHWQPLQNKEPSHLCRLLAGGASPALAQCFAGIGQKGALLVSLGSYALCWGPHPLHHVPCPQVSRTRPYGQPASPTWVQRCPRSWGRRPRASCRACTWAWAEDAGQWSEGFWSTTSVSKKHAEEFCCIDWNSGFTGLLAYVLMHKILLHFEEQYAVCKWWSPRGAQAGRGFGLSPAHSRVSTDFREDCFTASFCQCCRWI